MGSIAEKLEIRSWGEGVSDLRGFRSLTLISERSKASLYYGVQLSKEKGLAVIKAAVSKAPPGIIFASNPHMGNLANWNSLLVQAGFKQVGPGCAVNRVYAKSGWTWKEEGWFSLDDNKRDSPDGFGHWAHIFYKIKPGFDRLAISLADRVEEHGDDPNALFQVGYFGVSSDSGWEPCHARLSGNCGAAMGGPELPTKGVDKLFFTVTAIPEEKAFPEGWTVFEKLGGLHFAHNLASLNSAQMPCPHKFDLI